MTNRVLTGCPAEEHVRWLVDQLSPGAPACDVDELLVHCDLMPERAAEVSARLHRCALGVPAIVSVERWEVTRDGDVSVHYRAAGGHAAQLIVGRPGVDGRLGTPRVQRLSESMDDVEVASVATGDLTAFDRSEVHRVFAAAYLDADHDYVDGQLARLDQVAIARRDGVAIAFFIGGRRTLDLPFLGTTRVNLPGLACTDPAVRRGGVMLSVSAAVMAALDPPASALGGSRLATPATLRSMIGLLSIAAWPSADDPFALYRGATPTQRAVGAALAAAHGATDFDDEHFVCIGPGRPIGTPIVEIDAGPEHWAPFEHIQRARGDTLLWISWQSPPPARWHS